jgi:hypothetical protein
MDVPTHQADIANMSPTTNGHTDKEDAANGHANGFGGNNNSNGDVANLNGHAHPEVPVNGHANGVDSSRIDNGGIADGSMANGSTANGRTTNGVVTNGEPKAPPPAPVAIIGMSCRLPGDVSTVEDFWSLMSLSRNGWCEIPDDRFSKDAYYHPNPAKKGCINTKAGYFLKQDPAMFDAPFFNITRQEAEAMGKSISGCETRTLLTVE